MKKKGFTLLELLAVIVVLAIISLIVTPLISGIIEQAKLNSFKDSALALFDATDKYLISKKMDRLPPEGIDVNALDNLNRNIFSSGHVSLNDENQYELTNVSDGTYCASGTINTLEVIKGSCDLTLPDITFSQEGTNITFKLTDNIELKGYAVTNSKDTPTDWNKISGKEYIDTYISTEETTLYFHVIDSSDNKLYKEYVVELVKIIEINDTNFSSAVAYNSSAAYNPSKVTINNSIKEATIYTYKARGDYTTAASVLETKEQINLSNYRIVELEFTASPMISEGSYCIIESDTKSQTITNKEEEYFGTIISYIDDISTGKFTYDISNIEGLKYFKIRNLLTNSGTNSGTQTFTLKSLKFYR